MCHWVSFRSERAELPGGMEAESRLLSPWRGRIGDHYKTVISRRVPPGLVAGRSGVVNDEFLTGWWLLFLLE